MKILRARENNRTFVVLLLFLFGSLSVLSIHSFLKEQCAYLILGILFGYTLQRYKFCFAAGLRDIFLIKNTTITRATIVLIAISMFLFVTIYSFGPKEYDLLVQPIGIHTLLGGVLFGIGMVLAGGCATGVLMRSGEGYQMQMIALFGILIGSIIGAYHYSLTLGDRVSVLPSIHLTEILGTFNAFLIQIVILMFLYILCLYIERGKEMISYIKSSIKSCIKPWKKKCSSSKHLYFKGAIYLAIINGIFLYVVYHPISITMGLTYFSGGILKKIGFSMEKMTYFHGNQFPLENPMILFVFAIIIGSFISSFTHREFRYRKARSKKYLYMGLSGGILMGYSARIALGCNFGGIVNAIASMSLHGWVLGLATLLGAYLGSKIFVRLVL